MSSRDSSSTTQPVVAPTTNTVSTAATETELRNEAGATVAEDSNNNTSLLDRERTTEGVGAEPSTSRHSPAVREIHKNSWLKKMPCIDKWSGKFPKAQKLEKFWVVFCVHDDKEAFLEFYENRRSAYSHMPLSNVSLSKCLHISPTIVAQGNDHEFVITLDNQVIRLAASTNEQMLEWMDTLSTKLRELGVLEPKDNLYSKEPITSKPISHHSGSGLSLESQSRADFSRLSIRDPNSPLPPVPNSLIQTSETPEGTASSSTVVYIRNPSSRRASLQTSSISGSIATINTEGTPSSQSVPESVFNFDAPLESDHITRPVSRSNSSQGSMSPIPSPIDVEQRISSVPNTPSLEQSSLYEPLFYAASPSIGLGVRNPNYENPPHPQRHIVYKPTPALPPRSGSDFHRTPSLVSSDAASMHSPIRSNNLSNTASASDPSLQASLQQSSSAAPQSSSSISTSSPVALLRTHSHVEPMCSSSERSNHPSVAERLPHNGMRLQSNSAFKNGSIPVDENGKPISLREAQVQKLQSEILHKSGVRLILRKKDCLNAIAFVECFNCVWVAGWKQKEHPLLHNTFHVGDRLLSIAGHRILSIQDAHKAIKQQPSTVEFVVRRVPYGKILAIRREYEGQDLGLIREGGTAEIKEVKPSGLAFRQGLPAKASSLDGNSLCNWVLTEINHRPLNLFFKDNEVQNRLNAVGLDISLLVQPIELVKALKKQLKTIRGYKDYIVQ
ncbi:PH domain-containing protein [Trichonephila inaurata madagascariensis]|uniref:PH domain-containing protein n=1 Tax=Trichonephila inaurata madagascariensis TaxID=2747483 RepID=A0A8X7C5W2_9ARAC|nr:PH domain-containing protein [Trichonephila inaurata madagascariensis]